MYLLGDELYAFNVKVNHTNITAYDYSEDNCIYYTDDEWVHLVHPDDEFSSIQIPGAYDIYLLYSNEYIMVFPDRLEIYSFTGNCLLTIPVVIKKDFVVFKDDTESSHFCYINNGILWDQTGNKMCNTPDYQYVAYAFLNPNNEGEIEYIDHNGVRRNNIDGDTLELSVIFEQDNMIVFKPKSHYIFMCDKNTGYTCTIYTRTIYRHNPISFQTNGYHWIIYTDNGTHYCHDESTYSVPLEAVLFRAGHHRITMPTKSARF